MALTNDSVVPTVVSATTSKADGVYKAGETVNVDVLFSEAVAVTGTPTLTLETGSTDRAVDYASGSGTNTLVFTYTVQSGDTTSNLAYSSASALAGTIKDLAGNGATLALPSIGQTGSLDAGNSIQIDTTVPSIISSVTEGGSSAITIRFTEKVSGSPDGSDFAIKVDGAAATVTGVTVAGDGLSASIALGSAVGSSSTVTLDYTQSSTGSKQLKDAAGNAIAS